MKKNGVNIGLWVQKKGRLIKNLCFGVARVENMLIINWSNQEELLYQGKSF